VVQMNDAQLVIRRRTAGDDDLVHMRQRRPRLLEAGRDGFGAVTVEVGGEDEVSAAQLEPLSRARTDRLRRAPRSQRRRDNRRTESHHDGCSTGPMPPSSPSAMSTIDMIDAPAMIPDDVDTV